MLARLLGRSRLLGLLLSPAATGGRTGTPNDRRLTRSVSAPLGIDEALLPLVRFRLLRTVTVAGMWLSAAEPDRGDARGGVAVGAGSLDRAEWTRSSSFCILPISPRIWWSEPDRGMPPCGATLLGRDVAAGGRRAVEGVARPGLVIDKDGPREWRGGFIVPYPGFGVVVVSCGVVRLG